MSCHLYSGLQQTFPAPHTPAGDAQTSRAPVGQCVPHKSSTLQVTGEAVYTDDIPSPRGTLHGALVMSNRAHANIVSIDTSAAETCPGFEVSALSKCPNEEIKHFYILCYPLLSLFISLFLFLSCSDSFPTVMCRETMHWEPLPMTKKSLYKRKSNTWAR
mgnify:CR=1 FL=1